MLSLYGTSGCHLCEVAAELIEATGASFRHVDISESDELFARYGVIIPVLQRDDGRELHWPFDTEAINHFLGKH